MGTLPSPSTSGVRPASAGMLPDVQRLSQFPAAARCNTSLIEAEVDPAGSCKAARREPASEHGAASGIGGSAAIAIPAVILLSGLAAPVAAVDLGVASGFGGSAAIAIPDVPLLSGLAASPSSTSGSPAASAGVQLSRFPVSNCYRASSL